MVRKYLSNSNFYSAVDADNFTNQELFNFTHSVVKMNKTIKDQLVPPISKDRLSHEKSLVFKEYFGLSSSSNVLTANRCVINNKMYHSINYTRKGRTNSYTVSFSYRGSKQFGDIEHFLEVNGELYALLKVFPIINSEFSFPQL